MVNGAHTSSNWWVFTDPGAQVDMAPTAKNCMSHPLGAGAACAGAAVSDRAAAAVDATTARRRNERHGILRWCGARPTAHSRRSGAAAAVHPTNPLTAGMLGEQVFPAGRGAEHLVEHPVLDVVMEAEDA